MDPRPNRDPWVDYLRSTITVLVVAHHSALAYTTFSRFDKKVYINSTHPVVDSHRWAGLDFLVEFNDIFFMPLMFLVSGLFVINSLKKKGTLLFLRDRLLRLFVPFIVGGTFLMLVAYFPSYYLATGNSHITAYVLDFFTKQAWPVGPPWFLWLLFVFNVLEALAYPLWQNQFSRLSTWFAGLRDKPILFFGWMSLITWLCYVPLVYVFGPYFWTGIGPFDFQVSRFALYLGYFFLGGVIGCSDFNSGLFSKTAAIVRKGPAWSALAILLFIFAVVFRQSAGQGRDTIIAVSCALSSIAFISVFRTAVSNQNNVWNSLSENAYLIYLTHYVFVTWLQFFMLGLEIHAAVKFIVTFVAALTLSWASGALLRKIRFIAKYL
jgi:glucan biosynthesis protein C